MLFRRLIYQDDAYGSIILSFSVNLTKTEIRRANLASLEAELASVIPPTALYHIMLLCINAILEEDLMSTLF